MTVSKNVNKNKIKSSAFFLMKPLQNINKKFEKLRIIPLENLYDYTTSPLYDESTISKNREMEKELILHPRNAQLPLINYQSSKSEYHLR